jgi:thiol-disulfide isomerase/thioredoxin
MMQIKQKLDAQNEKFAQVKAPIKKILKMKKQIQIIALLLATTYGCNNSNTETRLDESVPTTMAASTAVATDALPQFKIVDLAGKAINLANFKGKKILVNLWASWCSPCRQEIPSIEKLYAKIDKNKVAFLMISLDNDFETAVHFATKNKLSIPVYYPAEDLPSLFNVKSIPATFIFDENGELIKHIEGGDNYDTKNYLNLLTK